MVSQLRSGPSGRGQEHAAATGGRLPDKQVVDQLPRRPQTIGSHSSGNRKPVIGSRFPGPESSTGQCEAAGPCRHAALRDRALVMEKGTLVHTAVGEDVRDVSLREAYLGAQESQ